MLNEKGKKIKFQNSLFRKTMLICWAKFGCPLDSEKVGWVKPIKINEELGFIGTKKKEFNGFYRTEKFGQMTSKRNETKGRNKRDVNFKLTKTGIRYILRSKLYEYITLPNTPIDIDSIKQRIKEAEEKGLKVPY